MKTLKLGMIALVLTISSAVMAQAPANSKGKVQKTPQERATKESKKFTEKLGLTPDQEKKVYDACLQKANQRDADREKLGQDKEALKKAGVERRKAFDTAMLQILTEEQKPKYEAWKQEMKEKRKDKKGGNTPPTPGTPDNDD